MVDRSRRSRAARCKDGALRHFQQSSHDLEPLDLRCRKTSLGTPINYPVTINACLIAQALLRRSRIVCGGRTESWSLCLETAARNADGDLAIRRTFAGLRKDSPTFTVQLKEALRLRGLGCANPVAIAQRRCAIDRAGRRPKRRVRRPAMHRAGIDVGDDLRCERRVGTDAK